MKNILIIAYKFPPMGGIGTRRWVKFAKYLSKNGYKVHILTIDYQKIDRVNWWHDIKDNKNIVIHRIKAGYPMLLMYQLDNKILSFLQKVINYFLKKTFFYIDIAQNWIKYMIPKAKKIILQNNINNVIVTNPPPSVAYYATYLKVDIPYINLIQDFRDSWNDDINYNYPSTLKFFWQKEKSAYMEWFVVNHSDYIVNVTEDITNRTKNKFKCYKNKFITIYNGYDKDDIKDLKNISSTNNSNKIKIIYAGSLGLGRLDAINLIMDYFLTLNDKLLNQIELNIYSSFNKNRIEKKYHCLLEKRIINFFDLVSPKEILNIINNHDHCLSINSPIYPYAFGTKIFDYMMLNKKIIHISNNGELSKLLKQLNQYVAGYDIKQIENLFNKIFIEKNNNFYPKYDKFDIENLIKDFERLFI